jgi:SAM-dependent methyltransferase
MSSWPWSDLVSKVKYFVDFTKDDLNVLELGCGAGANIPFFLSLPIQYFSIDGSKIIIDKLKQKFPSISKQLQVGDFTKKIPYNIDFDLIVDRAAITCNSTERIQFCLDMVYDKLKPGGKFIGIDWYSTDCSDFNKGKKVDDDFTCIDFKEGEFANIGKIHFSNKQHLLQLFSKFKIIHMEHKIVKNEFENDNIFATWNIVVEK